jgi:hypothetical protein
MKSLVATQKLIHAAHSRGDGALVLKFDYQKSYGRIDWYFLDEMLLCRGFGPIIMGWIKSHLVSGSFMFVSMMSMNLSLGLVKVENKEIPAQQFCSALWLMFSRKNFSSDLLWCHQLAIC